MRYFLNGREVQDVVRADLDGGWLEVREHDWRTGAPILELDGMPRVLTLRGKVRVEGAICAPDIVLLSDPLFPCPFCGDYGCSPGGACI